MEYKIMGEKSVAREGSLAPSGQGFQGAKHREIAWSSTNERAPQSSLSRQGQPTIAHRFNGGKSSVASPQPRQGRQNTPLDGWCVGPVAKGLSSLTGLGREAAVQSHR